MLIQMQIEGGFANIPALASPRCLDSVTLSAQDAEELQYLIKASNFFALPAVPAIPPRGADYRTYHITVKDNGRHHTIQFSDPIKDPQLQALVSFLEQHVYQA
ncbi:hypothetical protein KDA_23500 [Dictyobacter alpinus]|uniref:Uncharacterized protein n=1 Tax=Dictyobacter alpinus TaxID=2014873 RepID=A0A402B683_9CHLR|nr:protealysin inhibitor emfourin [Dictyobacter alpinus]GCE26866.1 hypothetical protein KDA_23500 [Dictyobacter alpinus]